MWLLIDPAAAARFDLVDAQRLGGQRQIYLTGPTDERLAVIVCHDDLRLPDLAGLVVDAKIGDDPGEAWYIHHKGKQHAKVDVYTVLHDVAGRAQRSLSDVLKQAPKA